MIRVPDVFVKRRKKVKRAIRGMGYLEAPHEAQT
jgi:hypothetical protein